jgi:hypothetical protein
MAEAEVRCPRCAAVVGGEKFCASCGASVDAGGVAQDPPPPPKIDLDASRKLGSARKWLFAISIITLLSGLIFYAINKSDIEDQIRTAEQQTAGMDPAERDARLMQSIHMTWDQAVAHDRGMVTMQLAINIGLAAMFFGLWVWAKRNVLGACVTALLLFITVFAINAAVDPKTLGQGVIVKVLFVAALVKAISAAQQERKLAA